MEIKRVAREFQDYDFGECFVLNGDVYMKIIEMKDELNDKYYNAVRLSDGYVEYFHDEDFVTKVNPILTY